MQCPECNTKLRKFKDGFICQNNHKFLPGSKVHNEISNTRKINTSLCPLCQTPVIEMCKCSISELTCVNGHTWTRKYYQGDKRYLCANPPNDGKHVFNFK